MKNNVIHLHPSDCNITLQEEYLCLGGRLDFFNIEQVTQICTNLVAAVSAIKVDLSKVTHSDSSALSMMIALMRNSKNNNQTIEFVNAPKFIVDLGRVCGLDSILPLTYDANRN
jgi:anti-anti-sigma factor